MSFVLATEAAALPKTATTPGVGYPMRHGLTLAPGRVMNRNPDNNEQYSKSLANEGGPQIRPANNEVGTQWTPYGTFITHPYINPGLPRSVMGTSQATAFYNSAVGMWPASGTDDQPNAYFNLLRLAPTTSARAGYTNPTGANPTMVFFSPPVFAYQTRPIYATGL